MPEVAPGTARVAADAAGGHGSGLRSGKWSQAPWTKSRLLRSRVIASFAFAGSTHGTRWAGAMQYSIGYIEDALKLHSWVDAEAFRSVDALVQHVSLYDESTT